MPIPLCRASILFAGTAMALAACHSSQPQHPDGTNASIVIGANAGSAIAPASGQQSVAINVPGFAAKVNLPGLDIAGSTQIENMPMFPGTKVTGLRIDAHDSDGSGGDSKGDVDMAFSAPGQPADVVKWYRDQAGRNGWSIVPPAGANQFEATRNGGDGTPTRFALQVANAGAGSSGHFHIAGR